ncbi:cobaltochelatase subunit CobN [Pseudogemmobacter faecipullorum]|uniref:Cobaltochelatase subunit CobN n=1 Tax=Pseudogemmobacter faecipullorum TaxID=2755041 RepID=A0ABS8CPC3_9RHOB|nr:cobaltochelatase subunit CobN [Pseudogemmobacter faecipullorum]MCB5410675.1 cobaltochelatase subunit CobN [Pseudogemmobacter faecipullorum]
MHVLFRESHGLEETAVPEDPGQSPADLVVLSFSDSDLGAFVAGWQRGRQALPSLRLLNLARLRHPVSVDTYLAQTLSGARGILIRMIGGKSYWSYGAEQVSRLARERGIALAVLPGDGAEDPQLDGLSTLPLATLRRLTALCEAGGEIAAQAALAQLALAAGLYAGPVQGLKRLDNHGFWHPDQGQLSCFTRDESKALILIPFYRSWAVAADTAAIGALIRAFEAQGFQAVGAFLPGLKNDQAAAWLRDILPALRPAAIVNTTAFSGRESGGSVLDLAGVPVFQALHASSTRAAWAEAEAGLSAADLAMHVALPEMDGRISGGVISFKEEAETDPQLQFRLRRHRPDAERIAALVRRVMAWLALAAKGAGARVALVLSNYPGKEWRLAHAVGLDAIASAAAIAAGLGEEITPEELLASLQASRLTWPGSGFERALASLPGGLQPGPAPAPGPCQFQAFWQGNLLIALQPERGQPEAREAEYHDLSLAPSRDYIAFYLWLRQGAAVDAIIHIGAHGTLEWLPGKAAALSAECWPEALTAGLPVIYPFIVSDPGEAAQARRRLGALTLGHLPPPLAAAALPEGLVRLEGLLDEFSVAEGLDPARRERLAGVIRTEARAQGLEDELNLGPDASPAEAITAIDRFLCDLKESQFAEGLHIWGRGWPDESGTLRGDPASLAAERQSVVLALSGRFIAPGPSGSPWRGRSDVLPTGRNLYGLDPRAVPSQTAWAQGVRLAGEVLRRHLQDHGDYPRALVLNLWGSATMRTAGEDYAMALHLAGLAPVWDSASGRVSGFEVTPLALLDRPRIDVTLRISGLFRDTFPELVTLFEAGAAALAARDELVDMNPYPASGGARVFSPAPGRYGTGILDEMTAAEAGQAWLAHSAWTGTAGGDPLALAARLAASDGFVLTQDLPESDILLAMDYAAHAAGFAAARGGNVPLYILDNTRPERPRARLLREDIARIVRGRASNPVWIAAMMRHGFRGAAEIAATLEHMAAFAEWAGAVPDSLFDLCHAATLGRAEVRSFLAETNPGALQAMEAVFARYLGPERRNARADEALQ